MPIKQTIPVPGTVPLRSAGMDELAYRADVEVFLATLNPVSIAINTVSVEMNELEENVNNLEQLTQTAAQSAATNANLALAARDVASSAKTDAINAFLNAQKAIEDSGLDYPQTAARQKADFFGLSFKL